MTFRSVNLFVYLFEIATASLLPVHHVMEDRDHDIPQIGLRHQRHLQERTNHSRDEVQLVLPCRRDGGQRRGEGFTLYLNTADCFCQRQFGKLGRKPDCNTGCSGNSRGVFCTVI